MTEPGPAAPLAWQPARITALERLTPRLLRVELEPSSWSTPRAGQHVDVRLTAEDGYRAQRSYSLLSPPERQRRYDLAIERLDDGEVSPWFHDVAQVGDEIECRGPLGGHFVWARDDAPPTLLVGGGSGLVPLIAMARHRAAGPPGAPMVLVAAARTKDDLLLREELDAFEAAGHGFTWHAALSRDTGALRPQDWRGRLASVSLAQALQPLGPPAGVLAFVCGRHAFVEAVAGHLVALGIAAARIRTERFGG